MGQDLWAITAYFNPAGYKRRLKNYHFFRQHLTVPLVTAEFSSNGGFELGPKDVEVLVQLHGGNVMWQKERLLNLALHHLPRACDSVAWLDCDIVFGPADWVERTTHALQTSCLIQPYAAVHDLG